MTFDDGAWTVTVGGKVVYGPANATDVGRYCKEHHIVLSRTMQQEPTDFGPAPRRSKR